MGTGHDGDATNIQQQWRGAGCEGEHRANDSAHISASSRTCSWQPSLPPLWSVVRCSSAVAQRERGGRKEERQRREGGKETGLLEPSGVRVYVVQECKPYAKVPSLAALQLPSSPYLPPHGGLSHDPP